MGKWGVRGQTPSRPLYMAYINNKFQNCEITILIPKSIVLFYNVVKLAGWAGTADRGMNFKRPAIF